MNRLPPRLQDMARGIIVGIKRSTITGLSLKPFMRLSFIMS